MVDIRQSPSPSGLGLAYNAFLFASVEPDSDAERLSTVSALARLGIDPWQEAAALTRLPRDSAIQRLAGLLSSLPGWRTGRPDTETIAIRLVGLLPGRAGAARPVVVRTNSSGAVFDPTLIAIGLGMVVILVLTSLLDASSDRASIQAAGKPAAASAPREAPELALRR